MKTSILTSTPFVSVKPATLDLAAHLGACMAKERVGSKRLAVLNRIYINMTAEAQLRAQAAWANARGVL